MTEIQLIEGAQFRILFLSHRKYGGRQFIADKIALQLPVGGLEFFMISDRTLKFIQNQYQPSHSYSEYYDKRGKKKSRGSESIT